MTGRLEGKVAIVTGAGSDPSASGAGIGQAISAVLSREGAAVLLVDRDADRAEATRRSLGDLPGTSTVFVGDVTSPSDCDAMVAVAKERFGGLDILVNNAAISRHAPITDTPMDLWNDVIGVNLTGSFLACRSAIPALLERGGGSIVNIGSVAGVRDTGVTHPAYCASKAGQLGLTIDLAGEYGRRNVRVNAVLPGMVATPMQASFGELTDDVRARLNLLGRMGSAWDIAHAVLFLCSDEAAYITGVTLPVDGGATVAMPASAHRAGRG
ncbi:MAG TPA: glucose 1-dehydrogenase [Acidimicrobiales bacterium]|nr:glucose 1-dehydrogenase [Acidimicrobiales bacterium]